MLAIGPAVEMLAAMGRAMADAVPGRRRGLAVGAPGALAFVIVALLAFGAGPAWATPVTGAAPPPCASPSATAGVICTPELLVPNEFSTVGSGSVTVLNSVTKAVITTLTTNMNIPVAVAITPDGRTGYVVNTGNNTVVPITLATNSVGSTIAVGAQPDAVAITPDGKTAYVANYGSDALTPITVATNTPGTAIRVGLGPTGLAITPDGKAVYVTNNEANSVAVVSVASNTLTATLSGFTEPNNLAITPDSKTVYVANNGGTVKPITVATNTVGSAIAVGRGAYAVAITPDGKTAYVASSDNNTVTPITVATNLPGTAIAVGSSPVGVAVTPDGKTVYVANSGDSSVTPITVADNTAGTPITVGLDPAAAAVAPAPTTAYVADFGSSAVTPINVSTGAETAITGMDQDQGVAFTPDGTVAYVANYGNSTATPITVATQAVGSAVAAGGSPQGATISPDGTTAWIPDQFGSAVTLINVASNTVSATISFSSHVYSVAFTPNDSTAYVCTTAGVVPVAVATQTVGSTIAGTAGCYFELAMTPNGETLYVSIANGTTVVPVSTTTNTAGTPITVGSGPNGVAVTPDGTTLYVANGGSNSVSVINVATNTVAATLNGVSSPFGVAVTPDGETVYVTNFAASTVTPITVANNTVGTPISVGTSPKGVAITGPLEIGNAASLPQGAVGSAYSQQLWSVSGTSPFTYAVTNGSLPAGLSLSSSGLISGTPTAAGSASFTVAVYDSSSYQRVAVKAFTLTVLGISTSPSPVPEGLITDGGPGSSYGPLTLTAVGPACSSGSPCSWSLSSGSLPGGLSLSPTGSSNGQSTTISGVPSEVQTSTATVEVSQGGVVQASSPVTISDIQVLDSRGGIGSDPTGMVADPTDSDVFVAATHANAVDRIAAATNPVGGSASVVPFPTGALDYPVSLGFGGGSLFASNFVSGRSGSGAGTVGQISSPFTSGGKLDSLAGCGHPEGVSEDSGGTDVWVACFGSNGSGGSVSVMSTAGSPMGSFSFSLSAGSSAPSGVAPDGVSGQVAVADATANKLYTVSTSGVVGVTPAAGTAGGLPSGAAAAYVAYGLVSGTPYDYVADPGAGRFSVVDESSPSSPMVVSNVGLPAGTNTSEPYGIATNETASGATVLVVSDANNARALVYTLSNTSPYATLDFTVGLPSSAVPDGVADMTVGGTNLAFIGDEAGNTVTVVDPPLARAHRRTGPPGPTPSTAPPSTGPGSSSGPPVGTALSPAQAVAEGDALAPPPAHKATVKKKKEKKHKKKRHKHRRRHGRHQRPQRSRRRSSTATRNRGAR